MRKKESKGEKISAKLISGNQIVLDRSKSGNESNTSLKVLPRKKVRESETIRQIKNKLKQMKENQSRNGQESEMTTINSARADNQKKQHQNKHSKKASNQSITSLKLTSSEAKLLSETLSREVLNQQVAGQGVVEDNKDSHIQQTLAGTKHIICTSKPEKIEDTTPPLSARVVSQANLIQQVQPLKAKNKIAAIASQLMKKIMVHPESRPK